MNLVDLLTVALASVLAHNGLQVLVSKLTAVATAVDQGDVKTLAHDAHGVVDWVETHDPALAKSVEAEAAQLRAAAVDEIERARHAAAEEIRKLAAAVESAATALPATPVDPPAAPPAAS
ncbi:hypothetical protein E6W39_19005 [Kitasatospora acidiphila]|uniref:Uncharacterized protein n=1 Tax=Kitasatospora acidiphila TaxID=2567942 RepID=A0A540W4I4_9ACTN|nr:hypothetical protein [Kitasatospora acidiphila]TQF03941.1 hypothetical protein E6W39_19005 [Kitasatospora acidiphila]